MEYIMTDQPVERAAREVAERLRKQLVQGKRAVWLLSGGSSMKIAVQAAAMLGTVDVSRLAVTLTDERYGPVGHADENWQQLLDAGFSLPGAQLYRPLNGHDVVGATRDFATWIGRQLDQSEYTLGIFGIGTDGHTAGIKPDSPAVTSDAYAAHFLGDDFERMTMTFQAIKQVDEAIVQVSGPEKASIIHEVLHDDIPLNKQPAQILKHISLVTIVSDQPS